jgi:hypothetical protein
MCSPDLVIFPRTSILARASFSERTKACSDNGPTDDCWMTLRTYCPSRLPSRVRTSITPCGRGPAKSARDRYASEWSWAHRAPARSASLPIPLLAVDDLVTSIASASRVNVPTPVSARRRRPIKSTSEARAQLSLSKAYRPQLFCRLPRKLPRSAALTLRLGLLRRSLSSAKNLGCRRAGLRLLQCKSEMLVRIFRLLHGMVNPRGKLQCLKTRTHTG